MASEVDEGISVNLGGEGEVPGAINVQPSAVPNDAPLAGAGQGRTLRDRCDEGHIVVKADNRQLPFANDSIGTVYTNSVPVDRTTHLGPGIQSSEVMRVLKPGGRWIDNGKTRAVK